ncbi:MAG: hypothetical protein FJ191_04240 [Gammaproteobacteria bacterium]|nr:hypothetical protein [Gammaproteobacteria bacterium]
MPPRLNCLAARLATLPEFRPPAGGWPAVLEARRLRQSHGPRQWPALAGVLALGLAGGLTWLSTQSGPESLADHRPAASLVSGSDAIRLENARLEYLLAAMPEPGSMRGSTAFTVVVLEDRLAAIDDRLSVTVLEPHAPEAADQLWRERRELLDSLVQVRYAGLARSR